MPPERPNILMIICHDLGQYCSMYGAPVDTPNIDAIGRDGVWFTNYHCTAAQCTPSRGSIFTGLYPHNNGLIGLAHLGWRYRPGQVTLQMRLREAGYSTHLFGVQHETTDHPSTLGYDTYAKGNAAAQSGPATCEFLRRRAASGDSRPFFACMGTFEPHRPFDTEGYPRDDPQTLEVPYWLPDRPGIREDCAGLHGMIRHLDDHVGRVRECLNETGLADNTLLIFTTDHGTAMPRAKGTCYDPGTKTTLAIYQPGRVEGGRRCDELLSNCDFSPTILDLIGEGPIPNADGRSFRGLLDGSEYEPRDSVFCEMTWHDKYNPMRAIRTHTHKYIRSFGDRPLVYLPLDIWNGPAGAEMREEYYGSRRPAEELYDLRTDPLETRDLASDPNSAGILEDLRGKVDAWMRDTGDLLLRGDWPPTPEQAARELRGEPN